MDEYPDDNIPNPVGNEHPLRGFMVGVGLLVGLALAVIGGCISCTAIPRDGEQTRTSITNAIRIVAEVAVQVREARRGREGEPSGVNSVDPGHIAKPSSSGGAPAILWKYGGFDGSHSIEDPNTQIGSVRMTANGMTYKWVKGGCENFGAKSREDADAALACFFYWDEASKSWIGGKADWLSTSRTSRDWENIRCRYNGWDPDKFFAAKRRAFCVVSKDGKKRTNLLETKEP